MMTATPRWAAALLLGAWLIAVGPVRAADEPKPSTKDTAASKTETENPPPTPPTGTPAATPTPPAAKPPDRPKAETRPKKTFRPSEEIHVDKAVDFPADI
ncbi:MAG: hypothetical protein QNJ61_10975 [Desulfobacterales bacterium]|nr:hypothetical protein [Desulfobacterales bacterium]